MDLTPEVKEQVHEAVTQKLKEIEDICVQLGLTDDVLVTCIVRDGCDDLHILIVSNEDAPRAMLAAYCHLSGLEELL